MRNATRWTPLAALLAAALTARAAAGGEGAAMPEVAVTRDAMITMRDGVRLAADVYRPAQGGVATEGRFPALLMRTPYGKAVRAPAFANYFAARGYVVVVEDVRGRYQSEGRWRPMYDDGTDGYDTAEWIGHQGWSDGGIGTLGTSYEGATQQALAIAGAPFVKTMIPLFSMSDPGRYGVRHNGAFELRWFNWVFSMGDPGGTPNLVAAARAASDPVAAPALAELVKHVPEYVSALPLRAGTTPLKFAPDYEKWLIDVMSHGGADPAYTAMGIDVPDHLADYKDIPVYHVTGWYDSWTLQVANLNFAGLRAHKKSLQRLIVGPWVHSRPGQSFAGDAQFTPDAAIDLNAFEQRWFDHWLKGVDNGVEREAPVRLYVMGGGDAHKTAEGRMFVGGHWRDEQEWLLSRARATAWYLHGGGVLSAERPVPHPPIRYRFDPRHPVPTLGGNLSSQGALASPGCDRPALPRGSLDLHGFQPAVRPQRRAGISDAAAQGGHGGDGAADREALGGVRLTRYGFHRQADRRLSAQRRLPARHRPQRRRQHRARALPQRAGNGRAAQSGEALRIHHRALSDLAPLQARPPHPPRRLEQQFSALRRESQHRRAAQRQPQRPRGRELDLPGSHTPLADPPAGGGRRALSALRGGAFAMIGATRAAGGA